MSSNTKKSQKDQILQIRYEKNTTKTDFLEVRAHFKTHEDTLVALIGFWKKNYDTVTHGAVTYLK
jgi:hypothetical protein